MKKIRYIGNTGAKEKFCHGVWLPWTIEFFHLDLSNKQHGMRSICKECSNKKNREIYYRDPEKTKDKGKRRRQNAIKKHGRDKINQIRKERGWDKNYYDRDPERTKRIYTKANKKRRSDPKNRLNGRIATAIYLALRGSKNNRGWESLVGYTLEDLIHHLLNKPGPHLTQEQLDNDFYFEIDHIIPQKMFDYENAEDQSFKDCWALCNLQPLTEEQHKAKSVIDNRLIKEHKKCHALLSWTDPNSTYYKGFVHKTSNSELTL